MEARCLCRVLETSLKMQWDSLYSFGVIKIYRMMLQHGLVVLRYWHCVSLERHFSDSFVRTEVAIKLLKICDRLGQKRLFIQVINEDKMLVAGLW